MDYSKKELYTKKLVIALVGLPARGKTYLSRKISRYINWIGFNCKSFNIGNYRRDKVGTDCKAQFFDPRNQNAVQKRQECAKACLDDLIDYLKNKNGDCALYDGTNSTFSRRKFIKQVLEEELPNHELIFVESICFDKNIIEKNVVRSKLQNPDYAKVPPEEATKDFMNRCKQYELAYQMLEESEDLPFIKIINIGAKIIAYKIKTYLPCKIAVFLMHLRPLDLRPIYLTRHGETKNIVEQRIGGDPHLNDEGKKFASYLRQYFVEQFSDDVVLKNSTQLFVSPAQRSQETAKLLGFHKEIMTFKALDELDAGLCDGLTISEIQKQYPNLLDEKQKDVLRFKFPEGESYQDLKERIEPLLLELESTTDPVIVISHAPILRCIYSYFNEKEITSIPLINIQPNTVLKLQPQTYFCKEERAIIDIKTGRIDKKVVQHSELVIEDSQLYL